MRIARLFQISGFIISLFDSASFGAKHGSGNNGRPSGTERSVFPAEVADGQGSGGVSQGNGFRPHGARVGPYAGKRYSRLLRLAEAAAADCHHGLPGDV